MSESADAWSGMHIEDDDSLTASVLAFAPWLVIVGYAWLMFHSYATALDWHLNARQSYEGAAPEDVLGFGFWLPWAIVSVIYVFALTIAIVPRKRKTLFASIVSSAFVLLSAADYFLYRTLERQVLGL